MMVRHAVDWKEVRQCIIVTDMIVLIRDCSSQSDWNRLDWTRLAPPRFSSDAGFVLDAN